jgi:hypothetical protein
MLFLTAIVSHMPIGCTSPCLGSCVRMLFRLPGNTVFGKLEIGYAAPDGDVHSERAKRLDTGITYF